MGAGGSEQVLGEKGGPCCARSSRVLVIDHNDSFTQNLVHMLEELGAFVTVVNAWHSQVDASDFGSIVLSPGPGDPTNDADIGMSRSMISANPGTPILGVCLGHQLLGRVHGASIGRSRFPMHGLASDVVLEEAGAADALFGGIPSEFSVIRYHSLAVDDTSLPACLLPLAYAEECDGTRTLMAMRHRTLPHWGVQYHPESICSTFGLRLLGNFLDAARRAAVNASPARTLAFARPVRPLEEQLGSKRWLMQDAICGGPPQLQFTCRRLEGSAPPDCLFRIFSGLGKPRVLLESSMVVPGFSRYSVVAGSPCLGPLSYTVAYSRYRGSCRCTGPGAPFEQRAVESPEDFFAILAELLPARAVQSPAAFDFAGGLVGYLGYEVRAGAPAATEESDPPDACFLFVDRFLLYDHLLHDLFACSLQAAGEQQPWSHGQDAESMARGEQQVQQDSCPPPSEIKFSIAHAHEEYLRCVERCQEHIRAGESYELCLTTKFRARAAVCPLELFGLLRELNPAPYSFMYDFPATQGVTDGCAVLGSSPERFLTVDRNGVACCKPMKGTARRNLHDRAADEEIRQSLAQSAKDRAENLMIVDLVRHDLSTVCVPASVRCPQLMEVETFPAVHQMVSLVRGQLAPAAPRGASRRLVSAVRACFPPGSMTGAPKLRSMELLHELENERPRGVFSGASGFLSVSGAADLAVVIRTIIVRRGASPTVTIGAGGAVTLLSEPRAELEEMLLKAERLLQAVARYAPTSVEGRSGAYLPVPPAEPSRLPVQSPVLLETMLWRWDQRRPEPYLWNRHYNRLLVGGRALGVPVPPAAELLDICRTAIGEAGGAAAQRVRLLVAAQGGARAESVAVQVGPRFPMDLAGPALLVCLDLQPSAHSADRLLGHKTLWRSAYTQARQRVIGEGSDVFDVVMFNERHEVTETSIANIAIEVEAGSWRTPPTSCGLLPGTQRAELLEDGQLHEGVVTVGELVAAAAAGRRLLCFNSVRGAYLVRLVHDRRQGLRPPG